MTIEELAAEIAQLTEEQGRDVNELLHADPDTLFILDGKPGQQTGDPGDK